MWMSAGRYRLIHFLDECCYFGIELNTTMLDAGRRLLLEPGHAFNMDSRFVATNPNHVRWIRKYDKSRRGFGTSYIEPTLFEREYSDVKWIGRSHESDTPGIVHHSLKWIRAECGKRGSNAEDIKLKLCNFGGQQWIRIKQEAAQ
jgi:hypothetical protein